jgi:soluble lytic murein transglycosylase
MGTLEKRAQGWARGGGLRASIAILALGVAALLLTATVVPGPAPASDAPQRPAALLRQAMQAHAAGDLGRAEALLATLHEREPLMADYADLLRLRMRVEAQQWSDAVALRGSWTHPDSPLEMEFEELLGRAYAAVGDEPTARAAFAAALRRGGDPERRAALRLELAQSLRRSGDDREAAAAYLEIFERHPLTPADAEAVAALDLLEPKLGRVRDAHALRRRGDVLYEERRNEEALAAYDGALAAGPKSPAEADRLRRQRAYTLFRLRRYPEAVQAFDRFPARSADRIEQARAVARAGDVAGAVRRLEEIAARKGDASAPQARLLAALLLDGENEHDRAHQHYLTLVRSAPGSTEGAAAVWQLGWEAYRQGHYHTAMGYFARLAPLEPDEISRLRARYWHARAAQRDGQAELSAGEFERIALEYPLSYYGWRASARVPRLAAGGAPPVAAASVAPEIPRGRAVLTPEELARPQILLEAGLDEEARAELDRLFARARGLDDRLALAALYADAGEFNRPQRLVVDAYSEALARAPEAGALDLWWYSWPAPFADEVSGATAGRRVAPELVYAIMREESGYRPRVLSVTGARGLLQLMPETAEQVARGEALPAFAVDDLFVPQVNIALGSAYLDELLGRFDGKVSAAIGSYNAGPHRVAAWLDGEALEDDEWVEAIPYDQTRGYVKRVLRSLHAYRVLY